MSLYLSAALSANRKGRFLQNVAAAVPMTEDWRSHPLPSGLLLLQAEELQAQADWQQLYDWAMQSGCAALVINPQIHQLDVLPRLSNALDWRLIPVSGVAQSDGLTSLLADELAMSLAGSAGSADRHLHQSADGVHTRYVRKHSNSGVFAVSTLPLWSLTLLDHTSALVEWLHWFLQHAGVVAEREDKPTSAVEFVPDRQDLVVLLLVSAADGMPLDTLAGNSGVQRMFDTRQLDLIKRANMLVEQGYISANRLTDKGSASFEASPYRAYAPLLAAELTKGAR